MGAISRGRLISTRRFMKFESHVLWESASAAPIVARVAVAGDFLPAGRIAVSPTLSWREAGARLAPAFEGVSLSLVNLECAIDVDGLQPQPLSGIGEIVSAPAASLDYLPPAHARVVGLANNHSYDFGPIGVARTRQALACRGITPLGGTHAPRPSGSLCLARSWQCPDRILGRSKGIAPTRHA
jgi:hypothetical protein